MWCSGRPIIYQAARAHEFTIIISPHRALRPRNPPARMVRSAVLLFGDVCRMIVGVDTLGFFRMVTRTASRTLRNHRVSQPTSAHGTFRGPFIWRRLRSDRWGRCVGFFFGTVTRTASRTLRNHRVSQPTSAHGTFRAPGREPCPRRAVSQWEAYDRHRN